MKVTVTARHTDISPNVRQRARELINRVAKKAHRPHRADVILDLDHDSHIAEFHLHFAKGQTKVSTAEAPDFLTALDRAADKLENHLDKKNPESTRRAG
jgi:ribosomal subunit interface protein